MSTKKTDNQHKHLVEIYKALADKTRLGIVLYLNKSKKESNCSELSAEFELSQPAFSHHCNKLIQANVINMRKVGTVHYLSINEPLLKKVGIVLENLN